MKDGKGKSTGRTTDEAVVAISAARGSRGSALKAVTANGLVDGLVVYFGDAGAWGGSLDQARIVDGKEAAAALLAEAEADVGRCKVVAPYLIDVTRDATGGVRPATYREVMRAAGPSIRLDLGKQAEG